MSSIPTKQIDGDVAVGRNVSMGGSGTVRGSMTVGHNLTVEGWLEAKNIKGPNKGLFKTAAQLREAYPNPHEGWWALVTVEGSASSDHLGQLYVADGGTWVAQVDSSGNPLLKGNPTVDSTEYMEAVEEMTADLEAVKVDVNQNKEDIKSLRSTQTSHTDSLNTLNSQMGTAQTDIVNLKKTVSDNKSELANSISGVQKDLTAFKNTKGTADGLAPLDENGQVPSQYLPGYVDDVLEFGGIVSGITAQFLSVSKSSTDENCAVVYNKTTETFVLRYTQPSESEFDLRPTITYYNNWLDGDLFGDGTVLGRKPHSGKIFMDVSTNKTYRWSGTTLAVIGSDLALGHSSGTAFPGDEGADLQERMSEAESTATITRQLIDENSAELLNRNTINANVLLSLGDREVSFSVVLEKIFDLENKARYMKPGIVLSFLSETGIQNKQWTNYGKETETDWKTEANWTDFGSNGSAIGNTVNVNDICEDTEYTLSTAIKAVQDKEKESGLSYMKSGVVLTYKTADVTSNGSPKWEAYQFTRTVDDINPADLKPWVEFGGGGNNAVPTSDTPEKDGKEAFSTGGAYANIPATLHIDTETQGVVKLQLQNAGQEAVGDEVQFAVGGGGGESTGTIVSIQFEQSPLYAKAGGSVVMKAAVRSVTTQGSQELSNMIEKVLLKDRDTGQTLETFMFNRASSASGDTYDFEMDVSSYFVTATTKRFQLIAYDDAGNTGSRNINVSGVDVTISSVQTLNYTASTALAAGGATKSIPMYKFANNASDKGIKVVTEIYLNGEWQTLGTSVVLDTYSHSITIDPKSCLGETLTHGAYPLRIHGEDVGSGVVGNYLHTAVMVVESGNNTPIVAMRWYTEQLQGKRKLYENIEVDYAVYAADTDEPQAVVWYDGAQETTTVAYRGQTNTFTKQVQESVHDGTKSVSVKVMCGNSASETATFIVDGSLVDVEEVTTMREFNITMDSRSNGETDKTIKDGNVEITVENCNWSSNGFVKDTYGTPTYGTENDKGRMALRIAEDMKAVCSFKPFANTSIEQNGMALSFTVKVKNVEDRTARIIDCLGDNQLGFYLTGEKLVFTCDGATAANPDDLGAQQTAVALYATDKETRFDIVIEPTSIAPYSGIGSIKIYMNGDEAAATYYNAGKFAHNDMQIMFDGTKADLYLYRAIGWATYYNYRQAFNNYLVGQKDTAAMLAEYEKNQVMASQTAEGTTKDRPTLQACMNAGLCCVTLLKNADTPDIEQSYPGYLDKLDGDKKTKAYYDWVIRFPDRPWQDCKVYNVPTVNQGTTSSLRPVKNTKGKFKGCKIEMLHTEEDFKNDPTALAKFQKAKKMAAKSQVQVIDGGLWVKTITIKVDYSDSTGANNGATMELMNKTQRAMGADYMTPAQNAYNGGDTMNTSIDSVTCALFRTDQQSVDATNETYAYFHAKANFNVDKGNPSFFGFEKVSGYNSDCLNYGDFVELVAEKNQDLNIFKVQTLAKSEELIASNIYMLSEYCGEKHIFLENDGTGTMQETTATADRIAKWAKITSSFDGERKYIENSKAGANYYYAVHGLRYEDLPITFEKRFAYRDGYYQVGELYTNPFKMRAVGTDISIKITAAQDGFFGLGVDRADACVDSCYLKAGESYTLKSGMTSTGAGTMLYMFGATRLASLDISGCTPKAEGWDISNCTMLQELILGGADYTPAEESGAITQLNMGNKSFLRRIDARNTKVTGIIASYCPRLKEVLASGSQLSSIDLAETAPIETLELPATMTTLYFKNLPKLTYPGGLTIAGMTNVKKMFLDECPHIDTMTLLRQITTAGQLKSVRIPGVNATASVEMLRGIMQSGAVGIDANGSTYDETGQCSGIIGRWILTELVEDSEVEALQKYFPKLTVINSQFSVVKIDDIVSGDFCERYSNPENKTGSDYDKTFVASGHTLKILQETHAYKCTYNSKLKQMEGVQLSDTDFNYLATGESFDVGDSAGEGFDIFHHLPHHWYKGVNDYKNQQKYIVYSTTENEPLSTVNNKREAMLSALLYAENTGVYADEAEVGTVIDENIITTAANVNAYRMDVEGMKQVRWPGLNHARLGAVFTDENGQIVGKFNMMVSHTYFDFSIGNYVFCDVPGGAKWMYFTSYRDIEDSLCLAVDSDHIEAIEPEWTEHTVGENDSLLGTYPITIDGLKRPRSISGAVRSRKGDGTSQTSAEWAYDTDGNPTETPTGTIHYTAKDFQNSAHMRGEGYQLQDYEQHKEISNLWWATHGTTNEQSVVGNGAHDATLNSLDNIGMADTSYVGNAMNSIMGLKHYVGCDSEWMDYIAGNVQSYETFYKNRCVETNDDPIDYKFHIYDPVKKTERVVQSVNSNGNCVVRVVHGAKCDILPSKVHQTDTSKYTTHYAAGLWFPGSRGRCVLRSGNYSVAGGGLAYAVAYYASSNSNTNFGGRLAFRGKFVIVG